MNWYQITLDFFRSDNELLQVIKGVVPTIALVTTLLRLTSIFGKYKSKQSIKIDLEILSLLDSSSENYKLVSERINDDIITTYVIGSKKNAVVGLIVGLIFFIGFGLWTVNIFEAKEGFSPWMILTMLFTMTGFSLMISSDPRINDEDEFLRIHFYQKISLLVGTFLGLICSTSIFIMISSQRSYSFFIYFILAVIAVIAFSALFRHISIKRIRTVKKPPE